MGRSSASIQVTVSLDQFDAEDIKAAALALGYVNGELADERIAEARWEGKQAAIADDITFLEGLLDELKRGDLAELRLKIETAIEEAR